MLAIYSAKGAAEKMLSDCSSISIEGKVAALTQESRNNIVKPMSRYNA
ncbi:hypothetical protein [Xenorhabdus poinarii]|nr:hypothetical protein [Xenorhabdus poinarii]